MSICTLFHRQEEPNCRSCSRAILILGSSVFFASGFSDAEEAVATGVADETVRQFFVSWNMPMHTTFATFYTLCFFLLLFIGFGGGKLPWTAREEIGAPSGMSEVLDE